MQKIILFFLLMFGGISEAHAQIPAGSIFWLRSDTDIDQSASNVAVWHDQSGQHNDATQPDSTKRPTLLASGINGLPSVHFNGGSYMIAPSIFPMNHDYSVAGVLRLSDTTLINNVLSGTTHAIWFNSSSYLQVHHWIFPLDADASVPVRSEGSRFVLIYNAKFSTVRIYIDGKLSDSLWTYNNDDSTMLVGSFVGGYLLHGDLSELVLYDRVLDSSEEEQIDNYLGAKYALPERPPLPQPDTTFTAIPANLQFFPRESDDSARFQIAGMFRAPGFDSIYVQFLRNGVVETTNYSSLLYNNNGASFSFQCSIHAELSEYALRVGVLRQRFDSMIAYRDSLVCGDAFLTSGQSNTFLGYTYQDSLNEFCRTFGITTNHNAKDTLWSVATSLSVCWGNSICAWSYQLAQLITDSLHIPVCIIDGATPGGYIQDHLRNDTNPLDVNTAYGRLLYKSQKSHIDHAVKAFVWDQGEWNTDYDYYNNFVLLHNAWLEDYPSLQKIYVIQIRPNFCNGGNQLKLKELQRHFEDSLSEVIVHASAAIPDNNTCHFGDSGYVAWGNQMYHLVGRDFYQRTDTVDIASPNVRKAFYTTSAHNEIELVFSPPDCHLAITADTVIDGSLRRMSDFLYLNDSGGQVQSITAQGNTLFLSVTNPSAQTITYLPDQVYPDSNFVYEGPWIVNTRGVGAFIWYDLPISDQPPSAVKTNEVAIKDVEIVPNPTSGEFSIDASQYSGPIEATLMSETGVEVWRKSISSDHPDLLTFDMDGESSGFYLSRLSNGAQSHAWKFILQK